MFENVGFDAGRVTRHRVLKTRQVTLDGANYQAVHVETKFGEKVVLLRYQSAKTGWWSRVYDP